MVKRILFYSPERPCHQWIIGFVGLLRLMSKVRWRRVCFHWSRVLMSPEIYLLRNLSPNFGPIINSLLGLVGLLLIMRKVLCRRVCFHWSRVWLSHGISFKKPLTQLQWRTELVTYEYSKKKSQNVLKSPLVVGQTQSHQKSSNLG
jgi:hypothetical protein